MSFWIKKLKSPTNSSTFDQIHDHPLRFLDLGVALAVTLGFFILYLRTMPPAVLDGDSGRWQYVCHALGISYPTGYPGLTLLGKLWSLLVPIGTMAYRISLMSVTLGALSGGLSYLLFHKITGNRSAALLGSIFFGTLPTTWWWSISIKSYALNLVFVNGCFLLLLWWAEHRNENILRWFAFVYGLSLTNHSTMILFAPAFAVFILLTDFSILRSLRRILVLVLLFLVPFLLYLYIPLRGAALWMTYGAETGLPWPTSVSRGLISSEYEPTLQGAWRIIAAPHETNSLISSWANLPQKLITVYGELLSREFGLFYIVLGLVGGIRLLIQAPRKAILIVLGYLAFPPLVVQYGHGMQSAFLLPCNLIFTVGIVYTWDGILSGIKRLFPKKFWQAQSILSLAVIAFFVSSVILGITSRYEKMDRSADYAVQHYWKRILEHPLEKNAGILGHSGVLVPMWYFQHIEEQRPDLLGIFPPDEQIVEDWLEAGHSLYLAGPLEGWLPKAWERYRLTPWGILVRIALHTTPNEIETIEPQARAQAAFGDSLTLLGYDLPTTTSSGSAFSLRLYWQTQTYLSNDYLVSLRLISESGQRISIVEDRLVSAWYPEAAIPDGRLILGVYDIPVPPGILPGQYQAALVVHNPETGEELLPTPGRPFPLGKVIVSEPQQLPVLDGTGLDNRPNAIFGDEIALLGYSIYPNELESGQTLTLEALWQTQKDLNEDYTILAQWVDESGAVRWQTRLSSMYPNFSTSTWQAGQMVRDWLTLTAAPQLPGGAYTIRIGWADSTSKQLGVRRGWQTIGDWLGIGTVNILDRPHYFDRPAFEFPVEANFSDQIELLGYDLEPITLQPGKPLYLSLHWQALNSMDTSYTVFVHLVDDRGKIRAQQDAVPGQGSLPTTSWIQNEIVSTNYELVPDDELPEVAYSLLVGLYDTDTGARLPTLPEGKDHVVLTTLRPKYGGEE